ncbi:hypothetical protein EYF80_001958 [Liparis tanakae]|uniref:Uncharacterized protein n=1 Tax=Liparis tanakae TaxID=230148 RepID=A0A4Z2JC64_9TELE|nr:hypothetical protein EYF80_001958 [Liparis tanakae]
MDERDSGALDARAASVCTGQRNNGHIIYPNFLCRLSSRLAPGVTLLTGRQTQRYPNLTSLTTSPLRCAESWSCPLTAAWWPAQIVGTDSQPPTSTPLLCSSTYWSLHEPTETTSLTLLLLRR